jgi:hypothetical protein
MSGTTYIEILSLRICSSTRVATCGSSTSALPRRYAARSTTHYSLLTTHYTLLTIRYSLGARQDLHAVRHARVPTTRGHSQPGPRAACRLLGLGRAPLRDAGVGRTPHPSPLTLALAPTLTLTLTPTPTLTLATTPTPILTLTPALTPTPTHPPTPTATPTPTPYPGGARALCLRRGQSDGALPEDPLRGTLRRAVCPTL